MLLYEKLGHALVSHQEVWWEQVALRRSCQVDGHHRNAKVVPYLQVRHHADNPQEPSPDGQVLPWVQSGWVTLKQDRALWGRSSWDLCWWPIERLQPLRRRNWSHSPLPHHWAQPQQRYERLGWFIRRHEHRSWLRHRIAWIQCRISWRQLYPR